jgi:tetratricopeptide (TPR) repeat protein
VLAASHTHLGILLEDLGKPDQAETEHRAALAIREKLVVDSPAVPIYRHDLATSHQNLGAVLRQVGKPDQSETQYRAAIAIRQKLATDGTPDSKNALELGGTLCNLGNLVKDFGRPNEALAWYDQAVTILAALVQKEPNHVMARQFLCNSHWGRASSLGKLERHGEAVKDWEKALALSTGSSRTVHQHRLMLSRAAAGQIDLAMKDADQLARIDSRDVIYDCACVYALAHARSKDDKHAARAIELLRQAVSRGFRDADHVKNDTDFDSLRQRDDFKKVVAELEEKEMSGR